MAYKISTDCIACDNCRPSCPAGAIDIENGKYLIDPDRCDDCKDHSEPQCIINCPISVPMPSQAKRGRAKVSIQILTSPSLFTNGLSHPFASAIVIWEACNLLAQRRSLPLQSSDDGRVIYQRVFNRNCTLDFQVSSLIGEKSTGDRFNSIGDLSAIALLESFDIRAACMHLIYAAHATTLEEPWNQEFVISDRQIEEYLGLDKRKDLTKPAKLTLIKDIAQQPCLINLSMNCPPQGRLPGFSFEQQPLWHLIDIQHYFQEDDMGCKHLVGLTFRIKAGMWAQYFLNKQGCKTHTAFYQYSILPKSLLGAVMSIWQQHEGAARILLWLLFKVRLGRDQRITVPTLMRVAYGEQRLTHAMSQRDERKRLLRTFESDLEVLHHYGLKPVFDPETYPPAIQPFWAKLGDIPDDAEEALEFWMNDGGNHTRLTDASPRGKWNLLMNARILWFELSPEWDQPLAELEKKKRRKSSHHGGTSGKSPRRSGAYYKKATTPALTAEQIAIARQNQGLSQRELAERTGKSQSWIRDIENGRFSPKVEDQVVLRRVLGLE